MQPVHPGLFVFVIPMRLGSEASQPLNEVSARSHKREIQRSDKAREVEFDSNLLDLNSEQN